MFTESVGKFYIYEGVIKSVRNLEIREDKS